MDLISSNQAQIDIKKFKKIKRISKGSFGVVYEIEEKETGELFAAKIIDCDDDEEICNQMIKREITNMMYAIHPTIIKFIGYSKHDFQDENNIILIMELAQNGSLKNVLKKIQDGDIPNYYTNTSRQIILTGVARGMKFLHDHNIIHNNLKTDNILLDEDFHPYITDFGITRSQTKFRNMLQYEAPEILEGLKYDKKVDVYSFAILMFEILTDSVPYPEFEKEEINAFKLTCKIINENYRPKFTVPVKKSFKKLIERCWSKNPEERPEFDEIFTLLSNKDNQKNEEDFMLDDIDHDEFNLYVKDITEVSNSTKKLLNKISKIETENKQLKNELKNLKSEINRQNDVIEGLEKEKVKFENENQKLKAENSKLRIIVTKYKDDAKEKRELKTLHKLRRSNFHYIIVGGYDEFFQLGEKPNNQNKIGNPIISPPVKLPLDHSSLLSCSAYGWNFVIVMSDGSLKGVGNNEDGRISATLQKTVIYDYTDFCIKDSSGRNLSAISAVCCGYGTLYMCSKCGGNGRQLVLCDSSINGGHPVFLDIGNHHPMSLFGGYYHSAVICFEGEFIFINRNAVINSPNSPIPVVSLPDHEKASSVACCNDSIVVLSSNGRVFSSLVEKESNVLKFSIVSELSSQEIVCVSGTNNHFLAVSKEGRVFGCGSNKYGQLGLGEGTESVSSFTEISSLVGYEIRRAYAGFNHSLFETREGKILSCGSNCYGQLLLSSSTGENVYSPIETTITSDTGFCIAGGCISVVLIGNPPSNTPNMRIQEYE